MLVKPVVEMIHEQLLALVQPGDIVVDATVGNGNDTIFMARRIGTNGRVYAFDIQPHALARTEEWLKEEGLLDRVTLICEDHIYVAEHVPAIVKAAVFNLGYLPGGDRAITTSADHTLRAIAKLLPLLIPGGAVLIALYWGHPDGKKEKIALENYVRQLPASHFRVSETTFPNCHEAPICIVIEKLKQKGSGSNGNKSV